MFSRRSIFGGLLAGSLLGAEFPDPAIDIKPSTGKQTVVLAGGCFWCTEAVFEIIDGVEDVISGYSGGTKETAKYDIVSSGRTGHAEAILVTFDPKKERFVDHLADKANALSEREYRKPFVVPKIA